MPTRKILPKATDDDTQGHAKRMPKAIGDDDTQGHAKRMPKATDDDTQGHAKRMPKATDDNDTEGQFMLPNPDMGRQLARGREEEIQRNLKRRENTLAARRPHTKQGRP